MDLKTNKDLVLAMCEKGIIPEIKISLIVGAGAVENAWGPVVNAIQENFDFEIDRNCANSYFANMVYLRKFYATSGQEANEHLKYVTEATNRLKQRICEELKKAQKDNSIRARKELKSILDKFVFACTNNVILLISTNWDTVIETEMNKLGRSNFPTNGPGLTALHIHGSIDNHLGLYLPSEITKEPYRSSDDDQELGQLHGGTWRVLEECNISILYGLSLDPLDAELCQTLSAGWDSPNLKEIVIIDPSHNIIAKRVKILLNKNRKIKISGYCPSNLGQQTSY